jgi:Mor family transcriptional regulator
MSLPSTLSDVAEVVGPEVADWLRQQYPGQRIRIPCTIPSTHGLARLPKAEKLSYYFGGIRLRIPRMEWQHVLARDLRIYADWRSGMALPKLAEKYEISVRGVKRSLARAQAR